MFNNKTVLIFSALGLLVGMGVCMAAPDFGPNVSIFDPSMTNIQSRVDAIFKQQERNQFGPDLSLIHHWIHAQASAMP
jgi:hypothetical protein